MFSDSHNTQYTAQLQSVSSVIVMRIVIVVTKILVCGIFTMSFLQLHYLHSLTRCEKYDILV